MTLIVAGVAHGRVRAMFDENGQAVKEAGPSRPVQVLGLSTVPRAGDTFLATEEERTARQIAEKREAADRNAQLAKRRKRVTLESFDAAVAEGKMDTLNLIIKGDVSGAVEALEESLMKIDAGGDEVQLRVIHRGVGAITQNDVNLATVDNAVIIGFNVRPAERVAELADREGVEMKFYSVIYRAIEEIEQAVKGMLKPEYEEVELGSAEIREVFRSSKWGNIAGSIVKNGIIKRNAKARLVRDGSVVADNLTIESLRRFKDDATEVREVSSVVLASAPSTTSRKATLSRLGRCAKSRVSKTHTLMRPSPASVPAPAGFYNWSRRGGCWRGGRFRITWNASVTPRVFAEGATIFQGETHG